MRFRLALALALVVLLASGPGRGQGESSSGSAESAAIRAVIAAQLEAFQRDDASGAYRFASPTIRNKFPDPGLFMEMVRRGYAPVYRPRSVEFRTLERIDGRLVQEVFFVGPEGRPVLALYEMQRQPDGRWLINGVRLVFLPGESVRLPHGSHGGGTLSNRTRPVPPAGVRG